MMPLKRYLIFLKHSVYSGSSEKMRFRLITAMRRDISCVLVAVGVLKCINNLEKVDKYERVSNVRLLDYISDKE